MGMNELSSLEMKCKIDQYFYRKMSKIENLKKNEKYAEMEGIDLRF